MFYVTFHGGEKSCFKHQEPIHTIYTYNDDGSGGTPYAHHAVDPKHAELRDIQYAPDGNFYLVNSYKKANQIWKIIPGSGKPVAELFTSADYVPAIFHPFAIAFDQHMQTCAISCQDTNVVVFVYGPAHPKSGQPLPVNPTLAEISSDFLAGTFVASQIPLCPPHHKHSPPPAVSDAHGGLSVECSGDELTHSVRGVAFIRDTLYVADEPGNCVRMYDSTQGRYLGKIADPQSLIQSPVHLLAVDNKLYITVSPAKTTKSTDFPSVLCYDTESSPDSALAIVVSNVENPSGMTFDNEGNFYLASRTKGSINTYDSSFKPAHHNPFIANMNDCPEFILYASVPHTIFG